MRARKARGDRDGARQSPEERCSERDKRGEEGKSEEKKKKKKKRGAEELEKRRRGERGGEERGV